MNERRSRSWIPPDRPKGRLLSISFLAAMLDAPRNLGVSNYGNCGQQYEIKNLILSYFSDS